MKFQKFIEDSAKKRKITVSEMPFVTVKKIARINSLKFSGNYSDSQSGEFWIAYCDTYVLKKNPCYFGQGNQILLFGEGQRPDSGKVANNGTFIIHDCLKEGGSTFFAFNKEGNILIQQKGGMSIYNNNAISSDGKFAACMIDSYLHFFDLELCSLQWKIKSATLGGCSFSSGSYYRVDAENRLLFLQCRNNDLSYRYDFEGNFLDKEKWEEDKVAYATPSELYYIVKEHLTIEGSAISPNKADELISLLNRALAAKETDHNPNLKAQIYEMLGEVYETQNEIDQAIGNYEWALSLEPEHKAYIYRKLGEAYESQYKIDQAIENYEMALHCNPKVGVKRKLDKLNKHAQDYSMK